MKRTDDLALAQRLLDHCMFASLSVVDAQGLAYCVPISPVRVENRLYFHCALRGRKIDAMRAHPRVCITCVGDTRVLHGEFNIEYQSAIAFGTAREITDEGEKIQALERITQKYEPDDLKDLPRVLETYLPATGIWEITLEEMTTKGPQSNP